MPQYVSIDRLKQAIEHLQDFHSKWILVPLVLAVNRVDDQHEVRLASHAGTDTFLDKYFHGSLIGLPDFPNGRNTLRPRFSEIWSPPDPDYVKWQRQGLWANLYSRAGFKEMKDAGLVTGVTGRAETTSAFWPAWQAATTGFHFEELLLWLYAFTGIDDSITSWTQLFDDFQDRHLGPRGRLPSNYASRFNVTNGVPWPTDFTTIRPSDATYQQQLLPATTIVVTQPRGTLPGHLNDLHRELERKRQVVLQGPPGTGKTWLAREYVRWFSAGLADDARLTAHMQALTPPFTVADLVDAVERLGSPAVWEIVQFHPSYAYEDFVRGLEAEPLPGGAGVTFTGRNKVLGWLAAVAGELQTRGVGVDAVLVVDEINRGDISKIFGELIYGLEYRAERVMTPYTVENDPTLALPSNLYLLGTMNTADRSIALIDYALRRRFVFLDVRPDPQVIAADTRFAGALDRGAAIRLYGEVEKLFTGGREMADLQVGHSYFLPDQPAADEAEGITHLARRFAFEVYPLLLEYETEGRYQGNEMNQLLGEFGIAPDERPSQGTVAFVVEQHLKQLSQPGAGPMAGGTQPQPGASGSGAEAGGTAPPGAASP